MLNYRPNGWRWLGRPLKRLLYKAVMGLSRPNMLRMMMMMRRRRRRSHITISLSSGSWLSYYTEYAVWLWERVKVDYLTVHGGCIHGSPSICMGNVFLVLIATDEHCARRRPEALSPVRTCPMCRQFSSPMTSMRWSPMSTKHGGKKEL